MTFDRYDVIVVPFPFTDVARTKRRPALVLSDHDRFGFQAEHSVMAMITSSRNRPWPLDVEIHDLETAGLPAPSVVRMKLFTLDHRLVLKKAGILGDADATSVARAIDRLLGRAR